MPTLTIIAGPNGSGKSSTFAPHDIEGRENLLDPDAVARRINPAAPAEAAVEAGREVLRRTQEYLAAGLSFAVETTLAAIKHFAPCEKASVAVFGASSLRRSGHDVPDADIRRRYQRSLANLPEAIRIADRTAVYDNSGFAPVKVLEAHNAAITWRADRLPDWAAQVLRAFQPE